MTEVFISPVWELHIACGVWALQLGVVCWVNCKVWLYAVLLFHFHSFKGSQTWRAPPKIWAQACREGDEGEAGEGSQSTRGARKSSEKCRTTGWYRWVWGTRYGRLLPVPEWPRDNASFPGKHTFCSLFFMHWSEHHKNCVLGDIACMTG